METVIRNFLFPSFLFFSRSLRIRRLLAFSNETPSFVVGEAGRECVRHRTDSLQRGREQDTETLLQCWQMLEVEMSDSATADTAR